MRQGVHNEAPIEQQSFCLLCSGDGVDEWADAPILHLVTPSAHLRLRLRVIDHGIPDDPRYVNGLDPELGARVELRLTSHPHPSARAEVDTQGRH